MRDRTQAFAWVAEVRARWDALVEDVRSGTIGLDTAFERADADTDTGLIFAVKVCEAVPGIGKVRSRRTMASLGLADDLRLAEVPADARRALLDAFAEPA